MHERRSGLAGHAAVAVGRAGHDALEQAENAAYARGAVERGDEMHLAGTRIGEAGVDPARDKGPDEAFRAVHGAALWGSDPPPFTGEGDREAVEGATAYSMPIDTSAKLTL